jgi:pimeloyl-ACP methyl ester carboxylesterase
MNQSTTLFFRREGKGKPLLLIHGLMVSGAMFEPLIPLLASDCDLLIPDLRGHGSSRHLPPPYSPAQHALDLAALLDSCGLNRVHVLGYSQGGTTAQQFARFYPGRIQSLILACTMACNRITWQEQIEAALMPLLLRLLGVRRVADVMVSNLPELQLDQAEHLREMIAANDQAQALASIKALNDFDSREWLRELTCPTLILAGADDSAVPIHHAHLPHQCIPHSRLEILPGAGHTLIWTHTANVAAFVRGLIQLPVS